MNKHAGISDGLAHSSSYTLGFFEAPWCPSRSAGGRSPNRTPARVDIMRVLATKTSNVGSSKPSRCQLSESNQTISGCTSPPPLKRMRSSMNRTDTASQYTCILLPSKGVGKPWSRTMAPLHNSPPTANPQYSIPVRGCVVLRRKYSGSMSQNVCGETI